MQIISIESTPDGAILPLSPIPEGAIQIVCTGTEWRVYFEGDEIPQPTPTLEQAKAEKLAEIYQRAAAELDALTARYSPVEVAGWREKEQQAQLFNASNDIDTCPELVAEAVESQVTLTELVATVLENSATIRTANRAILARRTRLKVDIEAATTAEEVAAIVWTS